MEVDAGAFDAAAEAVDDLEGLLGSGLEILDISRAAVGSTLAVGSLVLWLSGRLLAIGLVDVASSE